MSFKENSRGVREPDVAVQDEVLVDGIVSALLVSDLRAKYMNSSDASEEGRCAA